MDMAKAKVKAGDDGLVIEPVNALGMDLLHVTFGGVEAQFGEGDDWITLYEVHSANEGRGEVQEMLKRMMARYKGKRFGGSIALCPAMRHIYRKLEIREYTEDTKDRHA